MKTKEELNALKEEVETLNKKLHELTDEQLEQVSGGAGQTVTSLEGLSCKSRDPNGHDLGSNFYYNNKHYISSNEYVVISGILCMIYKSEEDGDPIMVPYY